MANNQNSLRSGENRLARTITKITPIFRVDAPDDGHNNMDVDSRQLEKDNTGLLVRFFEWKEPTISYGYLMDEQLVRTWAEKFGKVPLVKRPTGGGTVYHTPFDLSFSVLWPRNSKWLTTNPRESYRLIHSVIRDTFHSKDKTNPIALQPKQEGTCETPTSNEKRFSVCFDEPVCNDLMLRGKKVVGGALRLTKTAILYQGTIDGDALQGFGISKEEFIAIATDFFRARS